MAIEKEDSLVVLFEGLSAQVERLLAGLFMRAKPCRQEALAA